MNINLTGIVVIVGNYGSGKTEISINLAVQRKLAGVGVRVADLDLVNPYFRTREVIKPLAALGIDVVAPSDEFLQADLPILSPLVAGMLRRPDELAILDVGGDDAGATVLGSLKDVLQGKNIRVLQVVNPFRPSTNTIAGCLAVKAKIEAASCLTINGIVGNANLIDDTSLDDFYDGYTFADRLSRESDLPLEFVTAETALMTGVDSRKIDCPILCINRQLVPPWQKAADLRGKPAPFQNKLNG